MGSLLGLTQSCGPNQGGGDGLYLALHSDVVAFTLDNATGGYTAVTMAAGREFALYVPEEYLLSFKSAIEANKGASQITNTIEIDLGKMTQAQSQAIRELLTNNNCGYVGIVKLNNDTAWVAGYDELDTTEYKNKLRLTTSAGDSKQALMDPTNNVLTFVSVQREYPRTFEGTIPVGGESGSVEI
jgi:hypothetical protein